MTAWRIGKEVPGGCILGIENHLANELTQGISRKQHRPGKLSEIPANWWEIREGP
jgi:hypothetical protein